MRRCGSRTRYLKAKLDQVASIEAELQHLKDINDLEDPGGLSTVVARIASSGSSSFDHVRYINKGSDDGISRGAAVIDEQGLVGSIDLVLAHRARVRLILDPNVEVAVIDQSTSQTGIVRGDNENDLLLQDIRRRGTGQARQRRSDFRQPFPTGADRRHHYQDRLHDAGFGLVTGVAPAVSSPGSTTSR